MSPFLEPTETPAVRTPTPGTPRTPAETLVPPTPETTPSPRTASRTRGRRPSRPDESDPDLPPEPTEIPEAEGRRTTGEATPRRRAATGSRSSRPNPSRPRRPPLNDDAVGWQDGDAGDRTRETFEHLAQAGEAGARRRGPATAKHWEDFLAVLLGFFSMLYCWWLLSGFDVPRDERDALMLQEDEAEALATPMARILARSWLNQNYGKHVLGASDYVVMAVALAEYGRRTHPYLRRKLGSVIPGRRQPTRPVVDEAALRRRAAEERNGHVDGAPAGSARPVVFPAQAT